MHRTGSIWRGIIANTRGDRPVILGTREFAADQITRLDDWLNQHTVGSVLCVLPAGTVICRNCSLPEAEPDQLNQALRLQAEAHLLGIAPPHRLAMAVLDSAPGETSRSGIILAWPENAAFDPPPTVRPITFTPDIASLAALLDGERPAAPILWLNRADGAIALAITHSNGATFRATREDAANDNEWQQSVGRIVGETAINAGHTGPFIESMVRDAREIAAALPSHEAVLHLPQEIIDSAARRVQGAGSNEQWWQQFGVVVGALLARCGSLAALTHMLDAPPVEQPSRIRQIVDQLSRPRVAVMAAMVCVLSLMFGPLIISGLRLWILQVRFGDLQAQLDAANAVKKQMSMYREIESQNIWPMTKLMGDIANATPIGIELDMLRIEAGKEFNVAGIAMPQNNLSATQLVNLMQENLHAHGLFHDVRINWGEGNNFGTFKFSISGKVARPYLLVSYEDDFAVDTYRDRLYGKRETEKPQLASHSDADRETTVAQASTSAPVSTSQTAQTENAGAQSSTPADRNQAVASIASSDETSDSYTSTANTSPRTRGSMSTMANSGNVSSGHGTIDDLGGDSVGRGRVVPPPLSADQIAAMGKSELQQQLKEIAEAIQYFRGDDELHQRLRSEFQMVLEQLRKIREQDDAQAAVSSG